MKKVVLVFLLSSLFINQNFLFGNFALVQDPCTENDDCANAAVISNVISNTTYACIQGCNLYASPESIDTSCQIGIFPTVWYKVTLDSIADVINIMVTSTEFDQPVISLFRSNTGCDSLIAVNFTSGNLSCAVGSDGQVEALGTPALATNTYYIAVSSFNSIGGSFNICVSTNSQASTCVVDRNITVVARSNAGPLEGPYDPKEKVSICMNVNSYTAAGNGCQWFQGIVPVFGNGWDPSSYDSNGQPNNATINGQPMGLAGNGLYGASTWDWIDSVGYHYNNPNLTIADLDGNGRMDICNSQYEMDCPHVGVTGGSGGPCWDENQGDLLPSGWFAYGINGTCATPGPPIRVDWGDGNTCGGGMGPWHFCFDLTARDIPDCMGDSTKRDLTLGFFTFADGEIGSWTGSASVCAKDHPVKLSLQAKCGRIVMGNIEPLPPLCSGDTLRYKIEEPGINSWEWNISPFSAVPYITNHGENGFTTTAPLLNNNDEPVNVTGVLIGRIEGSPDIMIKRFKFDLHNTETCPLVSVASPNGTNAINNKIRIYPTPTDDNAILEWSFELQHDAVISVLNSNGLQVNTIPVSSHDSYQKQIETGSLKPGVYFVSFSNEEFRYVTKMVKL